MNLREYAAKRKKEDATEAQGTQQDKAALLRLQREQEEQRAAEQRYIEVCAAYNEARAKIGQLTADILRGLDGGVNPYVLLIKAAECIGLITGESTTFPQAVTQRIKEIYGRGLCDPCALDVELEEVRERLAMLTREELETSPQLIAAIRAHKEREKEILSLQERQIEPDK